MSEKLEQVFNETLLQVERASHDIEIIAQILDRELPKRVMDLPVEEVPENIRAFFQKYKVISNSVEDTADTETVSKMIKSLKLFVVTSAPQTIPAQVITAMTSMLDKILSAIALAELFEGLGSSLGTLKNKKTNKKSKK